MLDSSQHSSHGTVYPTDSSHNSGMWTRKRPTVSASHSERSFPLAHSLMLININMHTLDSSHHSSLGNFTEARLGWKGSPCCARSSYQARHACLLCKNRENVSGFLQVQKKRMKNVGEAQRCKFTEARLGWKDSPCCACSSYPARHARLPCKNRDSCDSET